MGVSGEKVKAEPQHNTRGTPCNIVPNCTSGKPAFYVVGKKFACIDHKDTAFRMAKRVRHAALPKVGFEPEIETVEVQEVEVGRFARMAGVDD
jgi:hypothetical protein